MYDRLTDRQPLNLTIVAKGFKSGNLWSASDRLTGDRGEVWIGAADETNLATVSSS